MKRLAGKSGSVDLEAKNDGMNCPYPPLADTRIAFSSCLSKN